MNTNYMVNAELHQMHQVIESITMGSDIDLLGLMEKVSSENIAKMKKRLSVIDNLIQSQWAELLAQHEKTIKNETKK